MKNNSTDVQQQLNKLARDNGIKIEIITNAWGITDKDGAFYIVKKAADLHNLINNLVKENK